MALKLAPQPDQFKDPDNKRASPAFPAVKNPEITLALGKFRLADDPPAIPTLDRPASEAGTG